jgi:hypothetical protein
MNYALDTPIKRKMWTPPTPVLTPVTPHSSQQTHFHHSLTWLYHKPQENAIFPIEAQSGRKK